MVPVGIYPQQSIEQLEYIIDHSDSKAIFVQKKEELKNIIESTQHNKKLKYIIPWTEKEYKKFNKNTKLVSYEIITKDRIKYEEIELISKQIDTHETAIIIYTSG
jgi:long-chain acyl-CoA synthetase